MNPLKHIRHFTADFVHNIHLWKDLGFILTLRIIWLRYKDVVSQSISYRHKRYALLQGFMERRYSNLINLDDRDLSDETINETIWIYWWQGKDNMPPIVKRCYRSVLENANGCNVVLITKDNYSHYVDVPEIMLDKQERGIICYAHFSDIYRCCLIAKYGGLWLDATILVTAPINKDIFRMEFYSMKKDPSDGLVYNSRYSSFCFGAKRNNILFRNLAIVFMSYIQRQHYFVDYFLFDIFIRIICDKIPECAAMVDNLEYNNPDQLALQFHYNEPFDAQLMEEWLKRTSFHKLTYKGNLLKATSNGHKTFYGYLIEDL